MSQFVPDTYQTVLHSAPLLFYRIRLQPSIVLESIDGGLEEIGGYSLAELRDHPDQLLQLVHEDDRDLANRIIDGDIDTDKPYRLRIVSKSGKTIWLENYYFIHRGPDQSPTRLEGLCLDITSRVETEQTLRQAEKHLRESENKYRLLVENQNDLVVKIDNDGRFLYVSPSYCRLFGKNESELLGNRFMPLVHEEDREPALQAMRDVSRPPYTCYVEQRALTKNGWRWLAWVDTAILDENKQVTGFIGVGRDITERVKTEAELAKSRAFLQAALEQTPAGVLLVNAPDGAVHMANQAARDIWGGQSLETIDSIDAHNGSQWKTFRPDGSPWPVEDLPLARAIHDGKTTNNVKAIIRRSDGEDRWVLQNASPVRDDRGTIVGGVLVLTDITELKTQEVTLQRALQDLEQERNTLRGKNIALQEILGHLEHEKDEYRRELAQSSYNLISPFIDKLRSNGGKLSAREIELLENALNAIVEKDIDLFRKNLGKLTPRELDICDLIKKGQSSKEIAERLHLAVQTVHKHRESIRHKLQLTNKEINLSTFLRSRL